MKTIKEQLIALGMEEHQFDYAEADLQFESTPISDAWINDFPYKEQQVEVFEYNGQKWYEIKNGYAKEYEYMQTPYTNVTFTEIPKPVLKKELSDEEYSKLNDSLFKIFKSDNFAYTSSSSYAAFWCNENPKGSGNHRFITKDNAVLRAFTLDQEGRMIAVYEDFEENDTFFEINVD